MPSGSCLTLFADDEIDSISQYNFNLHAKISKKAGSTKLPAYFLGKTIRVPVISVTSQSVSYAL
jgi:hypothetical protein